MWRIAVEVEFAEKETEADVGEEVVMTSSTSKRWSSRTAWRSRRVFPKLLKWKSFKKLPRVTCVFEEFVEGVGKKFRPTWDCRWMDTSASPRGHLWDKFERISRRMWWMFCIAFWDITTVGGKFYQDRDRSKTYCKEYYLVSIYIYCSVLGKFVQ